MIKRLLITCLGLLAACASGSQHPGPSRIVLAIHGGAGTIRRADLTPEQDAAYRAALEGALRAGYDVLQSGGSSLDAVVAAILPMEDSPLFNSGHGAVLTAERRCELDASIMDGNGPRAGAVAGVTTVKHPILAARAVMEKSEHVLLAGSGADAFAAAQGLEQVHNSYFQTERRRRQLEEQLGDTKHGTVGAVALDQAGHLAAATSTGGMTAKRWGRVGDSPIVGAGTYASDATCAVSATGWGEYFLRGVIAHDVAARMRHGQQSINSAANAAIHDDLTAAGGTGGLIALDANGRLATPFNTEGMYRAWIDQDGRVTVKIYAD
ncbi:MAG: beta-aspartyl-peptidase (threonine type) [Planctomycetota bacterium]|jgi:beta-aspartyl-peptidase (threonine type)